MDAPVVDAAVVDAPIVDAALVDAPGRLEYCFLTQSLWWAEVRDADRSCETASECWPFGYVTDDGTPTCGCGFAVSGAHGIQALRSNAYTTFAHAYESAFIALCLRSGLPASQQRCAEGFPDYWCDGHRCAARPSRICSGTAWDASVDTSDAGIGQP
jgi:hypothetical protein